MPRLNHKAVILKSCHRSTFLLLLGPLTPCTKGMHDRYMRTKLIIKPALASLCNRALNVLAVINTCISKSARNYNLKTQNQQWGTINGIEITGQRPDRSCELARPTHDHTMYTNATSTHESRRTIKPVHQIFHTRRMFSLLTLGFAPSHPMSPHRNFCQR
jgi:hypothetical protein